MMLVKLFEECKDKIKVGTRNMEVPVYKAVIYNKSRLVKTIVENTKEFPETLFPFDIKENDIAFKIVWYLLNVGMDAVFEFLNNTSDDLNEKEEKEEVLNLKVFEQAIVYMNYLDMTETPEEDCFLDYAIRDSYLYDIEKRFLDMLPEHWMDHIRIRLE